MSDYTKKRAYSFGLWAEWLVIIYLMFNGYKILERRYKTPKGEIDIIAKYGNILAMIEVKARRTNREMQEVLSKRQMQRITDAALLFIAKKPRFANLQIRFDLVVVQPWRWPCHLQHVWESRY